MRRVRLLSSLRSSTVVCKAQPKQLFNYRNYAKASIISQELRGPTQQFEGANTSYWLQDGSTRVDKSVFKPLAQNVDCDVGVVGAGIAGVTVSYYLAKAGKKVVLIDDGDVCRG